MEVSAVAAEGSKDEPKDVHLYYQDTKDFVAHQKLIKLGYYYNEFGRLRTYDKCKARMKRSRS